MTEKLQENRYGITDSMVRLYVNASSMEIRTVSHDDDPNCLRGKEVFYLYNIALKEDCTATDLVDRFGASKSLVSQTLSSLEQKGYIVREKSPDDSRKRYLRISPEKMDALTERISHIDSVVDSMVDKYGLQDVEKAGLILGDIATQMDLYLKPSKKRFPCYERCLDKPVDYTIPPSPARNAVS